MAEPRCSHHPILFRWDGSLRGPHVPFGQGGVCSWRLGGVPRTLGRLPRGPCVPCGQGDACFPAPGQAVVNKQGGPPVPGSSRVPERTGRSQAVCFRPSHRPPWSFGLRGASASEPRPVASRVPVLRVARAFIPVCLQRGWLLKRPTRPLWAGGRVFLAPGTGPENPGVAPEEAHASPVGRGAHACRRPESLQPAWELGFRPTALVGALGASDGVIHSRISHPAACFRAAANYPLLVQDLRDV